MILKIKMYKFMFLTIDVSIVGSNFLRRMAKKESKVSSMMDKL